MTLQRLRNRPDAGSKRVKQRIQELEASRRTHELAIKLDKATPEQVAKALAAMES